MDNARRTEVYLGQTGRTALTPRQARRVRKHERIAASPLASVRRASRMRKALVAARNRQLRTEGVQLVAIVRALRKDRKSVRFTRGSAKPDGS